MLTIRFCSSSIFIILYGNMTSLHFVVIFLVFTDALWQPPSQSSAENKPPMEHSMFIHVHILFNRLLVYANELMHKIFVQFQIYIVIVITRSFLLWLPSFN